MVADRGFNIRRKRVQSDHCHTVIHPPAIHPRHGHRHHRPIGSASTILDLGNDPDPNAKLDVDSYCDSYPFGDSYPHVVSAHHDRRPGSELCKRSEMGSL